VRANSNNNRINFYRALLLSEAKENNKKIDEKKL
jgi:hypothetical protein